MKNNSYVEFEDCAYRVLDIKDEIAVIICTTGKTAPQKVMRGQLHEIARAGPDDIVLSERQREKRDERFKIIKGFCEDKSLYWDSKKRRSIVRIKADESGYSTDTVEKYLFLYWSTGEKNTLAPSERKKQEIYFSKPFQMGI